LRVELGTDPKELKGFWRDIFTLIFTAVLFVLAKRVKQPKCLSTDKWKKGTMVYIHSGLFFCLKKEGNFDTYYHKDELWEHYVK
jgi:hypothetical protein